jgi:hypothetical protein
MTSTFTGRRFGLCMRCIIISLAFWGCSPRLSAAVSLEDVLGWDKTRWGMAPEDANSLYGHNLKRYDSDDGSTTLGLLPYLSKELRHHNIRLFFSPKLGLSRVYEYMDASTYSIDRAELPVGANRRAIFEVQCYEIKQYFNNTEERLLIEYGKPIMDRRDDDERKIMWTFPSTIIRLQHLANQLGCTMSLEYIPKSTGTREAPNYQDESAKRK